MHLEPRVERPGCAVLGRSLGYPGITMPSCRVYSQLLERHKPAPPGVIGCCPCTQQPFFQAVSQAEEYARTLSDPQ